MSNVIQILRDREYNGYFNKKRKAKNYNLYNMLSFLGEKAIMKKETFDNKIETVKINDDHMLYLSSIFGIEFSHDGAYAATSHTNRQISIIKLSTMKKISEININRTAWTMAFHRTDNRIIATGDLGGQVSVYIDYRMFTMFIETTKKPIASICFIGEYLCFGLDNRIILWDYMTNTIVHELNTQIGCKVRYIKFTPNTNMLITGISTSKTIWDCNTFRSDQSPSIIFNLIFNLFSDIIEYFEPNNIDNQILSIVIINIQRLCQIYIKNGLQHYQVLYNNASENNHNDIQDVNQTVKIMLKRCNLILFNRGDNSHHNKNSREIDSIFVFCEIFQEYFFNHGNPKYKWKFDLQLLKRLITNILILINTKSSDFEEILEESCKSQYALQVWDFDLDNMPDLKQAWRNVITTCSIHNDPTVSISKCGKLISTRKRNNFNIIIEVHSLEKYNLGEKLHEFETDFNCISLSFSPSCRHLLLGVRSDKTVVIVLHLTEGVKLMSIVHQYFDSEETINCATFSPRPGDGILIGYQMSNLGYIRHF